MAKKKAKDDQPVIIQIEKLGVVMTWTMRVPKTLRVEDRGAYQLGFRARTQDWNQGTSGQAVTTALKFRTLAKRIAFARGYEDARLQESPW